MKKSFLRSVILFFALTAFQFSKAQTLRYLDEIFSTVSVDSNIIYGENYGYLTGFASLEQLKMDVYQPVGDTATHRPIIILMHAGSLLPGSVTGFSFANKDENCIVELCKRYAKRGYVAVSMNYRLGWNPSSPDADVRAGTIINAVFRAMQDVKTCVRYFRHDVDSNINQWKVDVSKIVLGGTNSGAYVALAAANLNKPSEISIPKLLDVGGNPYVDTTLTGNFDGFGGTQNHNNYPTYSSAFNIALSLGGANADTSFIETGEPATIAFQGVSETLTPYNTAVVLTATFVSVIEISGSGDFMTIVAARGNNSGFSPNSFAAGPPNRNGQGQTTSPVDGLYPFYGQGFEPWNWYTGGNPSFNATASQPKAMAYIDTIMGYATPRMYRQLIDNSYGNPLGIREVTGYTQVFLFPNPASSEIFISSGDLAKPISSLQLFDACGQLVKEMVNINSFSLNFSVNNFSEGMFFAKMNLANGNFATRKFLVEK